MFWNGVLASVVEGIICSSFSYWIFQERKWSLDYWTMKKLWSSEKNTTEGHPWEQCWSSVREGFRRHKKVISILSNTAAAAARIYGIPGRKLRPKRWLHLVPRTFFRPKSRIAVLLRNGNPKCHLRLCSTRRVHQDQLYLDADIDNEFHKVTW